jgi:hypothetical protein
MTKTMLILFALLAAGCSTAPKDDDPYCTLWVEREVAYGGQTFKKRECAAWLFGPSKRELQQWERRHK